MGSMRLARALLTGGAVMMFLGAAPGCSPSIGAYCDEVCNCKGCTEPDRLKCVDKMADTRDVAREKGCGVQFNTYLSCLSTELTCESGQAKSGDCKAEATALEDCTGPIGVGARCAELCTLFAECGGGSAKECEIGCQQTDNLNAAAGCDGPYSEFVTCMQDQPDLCFGTSACDKFSQVYSECIVKFCSSSPLPVECGGGGGATPDGSTTGSGGGSTAVGGGSTGGSGGFGGAGPSSSSSSGTGG